MLDSSPEYVLREYYAAFNRGDRELALSYCHDDLEFANYLDNSLVPSGGITLGKAAFERKIDAFDACFADLVLDPREIIIVGQIARSRVHFTCRHRGTGEYLVGKMRQVALIEKSRIRRIEEYHDAERVHAFMRLMEQGGTDSAG